MAVTVNNGDYNSDSASDTFSGSGGKDAMYGNEGDDVIMGLAGDDYIDGGVGNDNLDGGEGNDTIWDVGSVPAGFTGIIGHDIIHAGSGDDRVNFRSADGGDQADGGDGEDTIAISFYGVAFSTPDAITFTLTPQGNGSTMYIGEAYAVVVQNFEHLVFDGNIGNDVITGAGLSDTLAGWAGDDHLSGMGGDDIIDGGTGKQYLDGGEGTDIASFNLTEATTDITLDLKTKTFDLAGYGTLTSIEKFNLVYTGSGKDTIVNGDDAAEYHTGGGDDSFTGGKGADIWNMGTGSDTGTMGDGNDRAVVEGFESDTGSKNVHGGNGNDWLIGAAGGDFLYGDNNDDYISGRNGNDHLEGGSGNDTIRGGGGNDEIIGGVGNDALDGDADDSTGNAVTGNDVVSGGDGNDSVGGGLGTDVLNGNDGNDGLYLSYSSETVDTGLDIADGGKGYDTAYVSFQNSQQWTYKIRIGATTTVYANGTQLASIKNVEQISFSANADGKFDYLGDDTANTFRLGNTSYGNDTIKTLGGADTIDSSFGSDTVDSGTGNDDVTVMLGGKDNVKTGTGDDHLLIQTANWKAPESGQIGTFDMGDGKNDQLEIIGWADKMNFTDGKNVTLNGVVLAKVSNWESLRFVTSASSTNYVGSSKDEDIEMQYNADTANGGGGDDFIQGGGGNDILDGGAGSDTVAYNEGFHFHMPIVITLNGAKQVTVKVNGVAEDKIRNFENITGGYDNDTLTGDKGNNTLDGWGGNDILKGGAGNDRLIGNAGSDTMTGGAGKDSFVFSLITVGTSSEHDVITDFKHGQDRIDLRAIDTNAATAKNDAFTFLAHEGAAFDGKGAEVRFDKQGSITIVELDSNHDRFADWHIELTGAINLTKADFLL